MLIFEDKKTQYQNKLAISKLYLDLSLNINRKKNKTINKILKSRLSVSNKLVEL